MTLQLLVFLGLLALAEASFRFKKHSPSESLQHYFRDKAASQQHTRLGRQAYYTYPNYYPSYPQANYYSQYYQSQPYYRSSPQYQQYPYYQYSQRSSYSGYSQYPSTYSGYSQPSSGGLQMDRFGNRYAMFGNFRLNVTCRSRGCPGRK